MLNSANAYKCSITLLPSRLSPSSKSLTTTLEQGSCNQQTKSRPFCTGRVVAKASLQIAPEIEEESATQEECIVDVSLGDRSYPIYITSGLLDNSEILKRHIKGKQVLIVTNETIAPLYLERCKKALEGLQVATAILPDGEAHKNLDVLNKIFDEALRCRLSRKSTFVALGGGVIGDMTGFAAASYQRGVQFIQIPTTVMATVDSSVGGKTGVNHALGKNMIGAFYQPQCVIIDTQTLDSLPPREHASGISEIIKYGLIRDAPLFEWLETNMQQLLNKDPQALQYAIRQSCINKAEVVAADEREGGVRATLNLGHTFGHAMETWQGYGVWLHGEAVAAGIVMAAELSLKLGWIDASLVERIRRLLLQTGLPVAPPQGMSTADFLDLMAVDKKNVDGEIRFILLKGPLSQCVVSPVDSGILRDFLDDQCQS